MKEMQEIPVVEMEAIKGGSLAGDIGHWLGRLVGRAGARLMDSSRSWHCESWGCDPSMYGGFGAFK